MASLGAGTIFEMSTDCETFRKVPGMTAIGEVGQTSDTVEVTAIDALAKEFISDIENPANKTFVGNWRPELQVQLDFKAAADKKQVIMVRITVPTNPLTRMTQAYVLLGFKLAEPTSSGAVQFNIGAQGTGTVKTEYITVVPVTSVSLNKTTGNGVVGNSETLTATVLPSNATDKTGVWTSSNSGAATVSDSGEVEFTGVGQAVVTFTTNDGLFTASCTYTVTAL